MYLYIRAISFPVILAATLCASAHQMPSKLFSLQDKLREVLSSCDLSGDSSAKINELANTNSWTYDEHCKIENFEQMSKTIKAINSSIESLPCATDANLLLKTYLQEEFAHCRPIFSDKLHEIFGSFYAGHRENIEILLTKFEDALEDYDEPLNDFLTDKMPRKEVFHIALLAYMKRKVNEHHLQFICDQGPKNGQPIYKKEFDKKIVDVCEDVYDKVEPFMFIVANGIVDPADSNLKSWLRRANLCSAVVKDSDQYFHETYKLMRRDNCAFLRIKTRLSSCFTFGRGI